MLEPTALAEQTVHGQIGGVKVSFLEFRPPLLESLVEWPEFGCRLASCADLAAMKLLAVAQRGTKKDFIDLYYLLKHYSLKQILEFYAIKYGHTSTFMVLKSLSYFEDAEEDILPNVFDHSISWESVKKVIIEEVKQVI